MINAAASLINVFFDVLLLPFGSLPLIWGLLFISLLSGLLMIVVFRSVSNQEKISGLRRRMGGEILGILLHLTNPLTVVKFAWKLIWSNTVYLAYLLKPLLFMAIPFMLLWGQLDARYGAAEMDVNDHVTVTVFFEDGLPERSSLEIEVTSLELVPPVMFIDALDEVSFRVIPDGVSPRILLISGVSIPLGRIGSRNGYRILRGFDSGSSFRRLFSPSIVRIDQIRGGAVSGYYSLRDIRYGILGGHWSWIAVFLVFSSLSAIAGAKILKVKI